MVEKSAANFCSPYTCFLPILSSWLKARVSHREKESEAINKPVQHTWKESSALLDLAEDSESMHVWLVHENSVGK